MFSLAMFSVNRLDFQQKKVRGTSKGIYDDGVLSFTVLKLPFLFSFYFLSWVREARIEKKTILCRTFPHLIYAIHVHLYPG